VCKKAKEYFANLVDDGDKEANPTNRLVPPLCVVDFFTEQRHGNYSLTTNMTVRCVQTESLGAHALDTAERLALLM